MKHDYQLKTADKAQMTQMRNDSLAYMVHMNFKARERQSELLCEASGKTFIRGDDLRSWIQG